MNAARLFSFSLASAVLSSGPAWAQIGADECAAADEITGTGSFPFDTNVATDTGTLATSSNEAQCVDITEDIWIGWTAPAGLDGHIVRMDICGSDFDSEIAVWRGTCGSMTGLGCSEFAPECGGAQGGSLDITVVGGEHYVIQIGYFSFAGLVHGSGDLTITDLGADPCLSNPPDAFEPNDDCGSATVVGPGTLSGLVIDRGSSDFYRTTLPPGHRYTAVGTVTGTTNLNDFRIFLTPADCVGQLSGSNGTHPDIVVATNRTADPFEVVLEVRLWDLISFPLCAEYELVITVEPETCQELTDDGLEPNDACNDAVPISDGFYPGLLTTDNDADYYRFSLAGQSGVQIDAFFQEELGNIDMKLWRWFNCGTVNDETTSANNGDNERLQFFNQANETREYILAVFMRNGQDFGCYDMLVEGALPHPSASFCAATTNSAGSEAAIEILGSPAAADQDVFLRTTGLPQGVPGLFYYGPNQIQVTFGDGFRCVGGMTQRILPAAFAMGPAPAIAQRELNFSAPYAGGITSGASLNFQLWYRDPMAGMSGFNLSDGAGVTFQ